MSKAILGAFGVTFAIQAVQPVPVTGFFADPVVAFVFRIISIVLSLALSGTIIIACIKMIAYFGAAGEAQRSLTATVKNAGEKFDEFASEIRAMLAVHDRQLAVNTTTLADHDRQFADHERRLGERRHNPGRRDANHHTED